MTFTDDEKPTVFSDADMNRLKDLLDDPQASGFFTEETARGLLARLDAAEACIPHVYANRERFRALEKWRKAAGK